MYRKIFVLYPRGQRTGGPEALHQLVDTLRGLGQEAFLVPMAGTAENPRVLQYSHYDAPEADAVEDADDCAIVVPEIEFDFVSRFSNASRFCWWLSIDNAPEFTDERRLLDLPRSASPKSRKALERSARKRAELRERKDFGRVHHLTQSVYAWSFLYSRLNVVGSMLSDYTTIDAFNGADMTSTRDAVVAFNYAKDHLWAEAIAAELPSVTFVAIRDMTLEQVAETLASAAIYLDMGPHPGKDRLPREAALAGAVTVVARRGAGAFPDVRIPWEHKVSMSSPVEHGVAVVTRVLHDQAAARSRQAGYAALVRAERDVFTAEAAAIFVSDTLEFGAEGPPDRHV